MRGNDSGVGAIFIASLFLLSLPQVAFGDTVIRSEAVDLLPEGTFDNADSWELSVWSGYDEGDPAEYTEGMVTDGHLSFTHSREEHFSEATGWSLYSPSESNMSLGFPDGGYTWSKGPTIDLEDFDSSQFFGGEIINVSLEVAFAVPEALTDDEVRFLITWGGNIELVRSFAHTQGAIDNMQGNPLVVPLDSYNDWTWADISDLTATIDYVSVGGVDDSEVRVDAVGLRIKERSSWSGFENAKALHSTTMEMAPFFDFELTGGTTDSLLITSCGLELQTPGSPSGWVTESVELPHDQIWGRLHLYGNATTSVKMETSEDGATWSSGTTVNDGETIVSGKHVRLDIVIFDGCLEGARIDLNQPMMTITGSVTGATDDLVENISLVKFALGTILIATTPVTPGAFSLSIPVGRYLPDAGESLDIGVSTRFQWSSQGASETVVVQVEDIFLSGGFLVEWDLDPSCENPSTVFLEEDGSGTILPLRTTCSDDITPIELLNVEASSHDENMVEATVDDGRIVIRQLSEQSGVAPVDVHVTDQRGNSWSSVFDVIVSSVDDAPTHAQLPLEVLVAVGDVVTVTLDVADVDTSLDDLVIATDVSWATIDSFRNLVLAPNAVGTFDVTITISDGSHIITDSISVLATSDPDLLIESVDIEGESGGQIEPGIVTTIEIWVRNDGLSAASLVTVRCYDDEILIDSTHIAIIDPGSLRSATCDWQVPSEQRNVTLRVYVDPTLDVLEVSETNNEYHSSLEVIAQDGGSDGNATTGGGVSNPSMLIIYVFAGIIGMTAIIALQLGPGKIRRRL